MALPATMRRFTIALADSDRNVYEELDWRVAQHPSESATYLVARVVARALEHADGLDFSPGGVSDDTLPALVQRDLTGALTAWIEIGSPSPERLHKASKASPRVAVYAWRSVDQLAAAIAEFGVHKREALEVHALDQAWLDAVGATLDRNNKWELAVSGGSLYLTIGGKLYEATVEQVRVA
jgi:uncharacterized protein YaeQ